MKFFALSISSTFCVLLSVCFQQNFAVTNAFIPTSTTVTSSNPRISSELYDAPKSKSPMFEYMKFDSNPTFDVLAKTKDYIESNQLGKFEEKYYDDDYVLRGPVVGPINRADLFASQKG